MAIIESFGKKAALAAAPLVLAVMLGNAQAREQLSPVTDGEAIEAVEPVAGEMSNPEDGWSAEKIAGAIFLGFIALGVIAALNRSGGAPMLTGDPTIEAPPPPGSGSGRGPGKGPG